MERKERDEVRKALIPNQYFKLVVSHLRSKVKCGLHYTWFIVTQSSQQCGGDELSIRYEGRLLVERERERERERGEREEEGVRKSWEDGREEGRREENEREESGKQESYGTLNATAALPHVV